MKRLDKLINRTSIRPQLFLTVAIGIVILLIALIFASTWVSDQQVRQVLIEQGKQATSNLSQNSRLSLLYDSPENADTAIRFAMAFPGVKHVSIYRADATLFHCSDKTIKSDQPPTIKHVKKLNLDTIKLSGEPQIIMDDNSNWKFLSPVSIKTDGESIQSQLFDSQLSEDEQLIGYVVITSSKDSLKNISRGILLSNAVIALVIGLLILLALQKTIKRLTQPLHSISTVMQKVEQGEYISHISSAGPLEAHHIANAFNRMIAALAERDEALRKQNIHLEKQASHDHLSGLMNRIGFEQSLRLAIAECKTQRVQHALCYMDLDKFKVVNDSCGHNAGDELLKIISNIFRKHVRKDSDALSRVGGDEFSLILKNCSLEKARSICENIRQDVIDYCFECNGKTFSVGVSIGIVQINGIENTVDAIVAKADRACYTAKAQGRNQVFVAEHKQLHTSHTARSNTAAAEIEHEDRLRNRPGSSDE